MNAAFRWIAFVFAVGLVGLAIPASRASSLQTNDDDLTILAAVVLFLPVAVMSPFAKANRSRLAVAGAFAGAWLVQLWALSWIEGYSWTEVLQQGGNVALWAWTIVYFLSLPALFTVLAVEVQRSTSQEVSGA